jgi:hypothetical protein
MWLRRLIWRLNGQSLDETLRELREQTESLRKSNARSDALNARWIDMTERIGRTNVWESSRMKGFSPLSPEQKPLQPLQPTLDDPLTMWLWKRAWDGCAEMAMWDLMTASAAIARAIREEGIPLSDGLRAAAAPYRGSE